VETDKKTIKIEIRTSTVGSKQYAVNLSL